MKNLVTLTYKSSISSFKNINGSFDSGVLRVCYVGDNRNGSSISKDTFLNCMNSIYNCPVVCNYDRETDSIGEHDMEVVVKNDKMTIVNKTDPIGVVPNGANWWFEKEDGFEYLCVDVILWKRQEAYSHIRDNGITDESMEISVLASHQRKDGMLEIDQFEFTAFCLLESAQPCYEGASLSVYSDRNDDYNRFKEKYVEMMNEIKQTGALLFAQENSNRKEKYDLKNEILSKFGLTAEQLQIEDIESISVEDLEMRCKEFSITYKQLEGQIFEALCAETYTDEYGTWNKYIYMDHDDGEVFVADCTNDYKLFGLSYSMDGDNVVIDFSSCKRKKICYMDFEEGSREYSLNDFASDISERSKITLNAENEEKFAEFEKKEEEFATCRVEFEKKEEEFAAKEEEMSAKIEELTAFKTEVEEKEHIAEVEAVFEQFEDLNDVEEFITLRKEYGDMSVQDIEEKCFSIRGRTMKFAHKSTKKTPVRIPAKEPSNGDEPYGGLFDLYPPSN